MEGRGVVPDFELGEAEYDHSLNRGISVSGEHWLYFVRGRLTFLKGCLDSLRESPRRVLDFGCGSGGASPWLRDTFEAESVLGVDVSQRLLEAARVSHGTDRVRFARRDQEKPAAERDLAFCNGVFHHIPPAERSDAIRYVRDSLRPGGLFALWDNNPWNPGARYVMSRIPFDRDAVMLSSREAARLLKEHGFQVLRVDYLFVFPRFLRVLRWLEGPLSRVPLGAQFQVLARRPGSSDRLEPLTP